MTAAPRTAILGQWFARTANLRYWFDAGICSGIARGVAGGKGVNAWRRWPGGKLLPEPRPARTRERPMATSLLFTGHMIDLPNRAEPRFPAPLEDAARMRIAKAIAPYAPRSAGQSEGAETSAVLGFASGARGGDLLFHEECRRRGIHTVVVLPFKPDKFIETSVRMESGFREVLTASWRRFWSGRRSWESRFWTVWSQTSADRRHDIGLDPENNDAYDICNTRLLDMARQYGRIHLIALWDGKGSGGKGGTADLVSIAKTEAGDQPDIFSPHDLRE
jgi:hypothetical protein